MTKKAEFLLPEGVIYLDGNSLGPLPKNAPKVMEDTMRQEWGDMLITAWNKAGWMDLPVKVGNLIAPIIGVAQNTVTLGDTLSIKMMQALHAAILLNPGRRVILSDSGNFPTDLYMAQGLLKAIGRYELRIVEPENVAAAINDDTAVMMLTHVDYRTGRMHDMEALTRLAHAHGTIALWDLAHSAGAVELKLEEWQVDLAAGCTYKYLNGGPGAPAFIYIRPDHVNHVEPLMSGWLGHEAPFAFDLDYRPKAGIARMRVGTPPILQLRVLENALGLFDGIKMRDIREKSVNLTTIFVELLDGIPELRLSSPRESQFRGSQISFSHPKAYEIMQTLIANGVIGDFRAPNMMRFGFTPLYIDEDEVKNAATIIRRVIVNREFEKLEYSLRAQVT